VREIVVLNVFVALQDRMSLATHSLANEGRDVPTTYASAAYMAPEQAPRRRTDRRAVSTGGLWRGWAAKRPASPRC
jgi:hypothetical protein